MAKLAPAPAVSDRTAKILEKMASGQKLVMSRTRPFVPHKCEMGGGELSPTTVARLTALGLVRPVPQDALWDRIEYELTDTGRQALEQYEEDRVTRNLAKKRERGNNAR